MSKNTTKYIKIIFLDVFLKYLSLFILFTFIYQITLLNIDSRSWALFGYPIAFIVFWLLVLFVINDSIKRIIGQSVPDAKQIIFIGTATALLIVFSWMVIRIGTSLVFPGWVIPVDLSGFNFSLPSSFLQLQLKPFIGIEAFLAQFFGATIFIASFILIKLRAFSLKTNLLYTALLFIGAILMIGVQIKYSYSYYKVIPNLIADHETFNLSQSSPATNWQQYSNPKFGTKISYPDSWEYREESKKNTVYFYPVSEKTKAIPNGVKLSWRNYDLSKSELSQIPTDTTNQEDQWVMRDSQDYINDKYASFTIYNLAVSSMPEKTISRKALWNVGYTQHSPVGSGTYLFDLSISVDDSGKFKFGDIFQSMLSTLQP